MNRYLILSLSLLTVIFIFKFLYKPKNTTESYTASDGKLLVTDINGNLLLTPNILNDLQTKAQAQTQAQTEANQITTLTNQINTLSDQINRIINGTTPIQNLNVNGVLTVNSSDARPIRMNKSGDKTTLLSFQFNGNEINAFGLDSVGNHWGGYNASGWWNP